MKKLLLTVLFVGLAVGTAQAGISNPETFETYAVGTFTPGGSDGWTFGPFSGGVQWEDLTSVDIVTPGIDQKYLSIQTAAWGGRMYWGEVLDTTAIPVQVLEFTTRIPSGDGVRRIIINPHRGTAAQYYQFPGTLHIRPGVEMLLQSGPVAGGSGNILTQLPGVGTGEFDTWYTVQMELTHDPGHANGNGGTVRARIGIAGDAFGAWTTPAAFFSYYGGYYERIMISTTTAADIDNISLTPEPATLALLGAGSLLLIRRKKR